MKKTVMKETCAASSSGLTRVLGISWVYDLFQEGVGANAARRIFVENNVRPKPGDKIVDIGCGPAQLLRWLPNTRYIGLDVSETYIETARRQYGRGGVFLVGDTKTLWDAPEVMNADIAVCSAVLHHLNDEEARHAMDFAHRILKWGGRFLALDPCWVPKQGMVAKWIMSKDRGKYIRTEEGYRGLAAKAFRKVKTTIEMRPIRIPTTAVVTECEK